MEASPWLRSLVWTDYRLMVLFAVIIPLGLLIWSVIRKAETMQRLLIIYWRVASLLAISIYLMIAELPVSFLSAFLARFLIAIGLWFWVDLNEDIEEQPTSVLKLAFTSWRWAMTVYCLGGGLLLIQALQCAIPQFLQANHAFCQVWFEAPWGYKVLFHAKSSPGFLGFLGVLGLVVYVFYLGYFVLFRLGKQGRSALEL